MSNIVNLISLQQFRAFCPTNAIVDDASIAAAINHAQASLVPTIFGYKFYRQLMDSVINHSPEPVLDYLGPVLACRAASHLAIMTSAQIFPANVETVPGDAVRLQNYYQNQASTYLRQLYLFCDEVKIPYTPWKSVSDCCINLSGGHGRHSY